MSHDPQEGESVRPRSLVDRGPGLGGALLEIISGILQPWALGVFALAFLVRLVFCLVVDQPLLFAHQYHYFTNGLRIAESSHPIAFILLSDKWRTWAEHWTIAPLYYIFEGAVFRIFGPHLRALEVIQCLFGGVTALAVAVVGRELVGARGYWAGILYAVYAQSVELPSWTLTENLHNVLFAVGVALALKAAGEHRGLGWAAAAGVVLGVSALARSVSSAFIPLTGLWLLWAARRKRWQRAGVLVASGILAILPWTLRNIALGEWVPIETTVYENMWTANGFSTPERRLRQERFIAHRATAEEKRKAAMRFALRGIRRHPDIFWKKVQANFWHYFRPEGLRYFLVIQGSIEPWRHLLTIVLEDGIVVGLIPFWLVSLFAGQRSPPWALLSVWCLYMLFFEIVVFLSEVPRHRSVFVPFALVMALDGVRILRHPARRRRTPTLLALLLSLLWVGALIRPYVGPAWRGFWAARSVSSAVAVMDQGDRDRAEELVESAAARDPTSARVWFDYGRALVARARVADAAEAYRKGATRAYSENLRATLALPQLLRSVGQAEAASEALARANQVSWTFDPWLALEAAWRELPAPETDEVRLGDGDYGAVRGFLQPRGSGGVPQGLAWVDQENEGGQVPPGTHRWTLRRAFVRLRPVSVSALEDVVLLMGSPYPSPVPHPRVVVTVNGISVPFVLDPELRSYAVRVPRTSEILVEIESPTWNRGTEPAEQGIRLDRVSVRPGH